VDALDFAIYRHLSRDGLARFWASRRLVDPQVSTREIAEKVELSEAGVRARLRGMRAAGFLRGTEVGVNPSLFGASVVVHEVPVRGARDAEQLFRDLASVDGVLFARDLLADEDRRVSVYCAVDNAGASARKTSLLRRLAPGGAVRGPFPYWIPACTRAPSPLDWRLLALFRRQPDSTLSRIASNARVSLKTTSRRFDALVGSRACWWSHSSDSAELPLALLSVSVREDADPIRVSGEIARTTQGWIPVAPDGLGVDPGGGTRSLAGLVPAVHPAALEALVRQTEGLEGVSDVRRTFGLGSATYRDWIDERLGSVLPPRS